MTRRALAPAAIVAAFVVSLTLAVVGGSPNGPLLARGGPLGPAGAGGTGAGTSTATGSSGTSQVPDQVRGGPARPIVGSAARHDTSKPLASIQPGAPEQGAQDADAQAPLPLPGRSGSVSRAARDPVLQSAPVGGAAPATIVRSFDGVTNINGVLPPDTNGDIGPNDYVQWVNLSFAIYNRSGSLLYGPAAGNTLWSGFGGPCESTNDGDPIAQYDHLADRWVMSQFGLPNYPSGPFYECVAVSTTADPLGTWYRYQFLISNTKLDDYPHLGVWPDAYYMSTNQFSGNSWGGQGAVAFERSRMLQGLSAQMVYFDLFGVDPNLGGMLPSDLDGPAPPSGAPNVYAEADDNANGYPQDQLDLWDFHVDWTTPGNSTFTHDVSLATAAMDTNLCGYARNCINQPQPAHGKSITGLDALSDRIMYRLQYRNFGAYQTLVTTNTVDVDGSDHAGIRWWEVRDTGSGWAIRQQGTWSPDGSDRWMASAAMNATGDIAIGYSVSSGSVFPSIRLAGRAAADPLGTLTVSETSIQAGAGAQTDSQARWGDYSMLAVDPADGCTFWYTNEYLAATGDAPWRTRIAEVRLPGCGSGGDTTPPAVSSFAPTTSSPTSATTIGYALGFDESVTGLSAADFTRTGTATGCTVGAPSGSAASYTLNVTGCSEGTVILTLNAGTVTDGSSNAGPTAPSTASTVTIDRTAPTASLTAPASPTNVATLAYGVTFNQSVTGLAAGDFATTGTATGCLVGAPSGAGASYSVNVSGCSEGTVILTLAASSVMDAATNVGPTSPSSASTVTIDRTLPTANVTAPASPTNVATLGYSVTFDESVTGLSATDFTRTGTATGCTVAAPAGSGASYTLNVTGCSDGTVILTLKAGTVTDAATNVGPTSPSTASTVTIDRTAPTATVTAPASPTNAATLGYAVTFNQSVTGLAAGDFTTTGTATGCAVGAPSGSAASYTVSLTGCSVGTVVLTLTAGTVTDAATNVGPASDVAAGSVLIDRSAPTVTAPNANLRSGVTLSGGSLPVVVTWTGSDTGGAGVATYDVMRSLDAAAFVTLATGLTTPSMNTLQSSGHTYRYEVRAHDHAGNIGGWLAGPTFSPTLLQQTSSSILYHGTWTTSTSTSYSGGSARYATSAGASATYTFTGKSVAFVTTRSSSRGAVKIYLDGVLVKTFDCFASTTAYRYVAYARNFGVTGTHTLKIVVVGTAGRPRVDFDALEVLR